ncbi:penicillin-binding protein 1C [Treponema sp. OMZ 840]|uniref:penicillin-binding protein 1C n=1 Tax=Treponema sp. OMZ 840 TaxID=244313 RepID=UPI003D8D5535
MKRFFKRKKIIIPALLLCICALIVVSDFKIARSKGILHGIDFSGAYTDKKGTLLKVYLTNDECYRIYKPVSEYPGEFLEALLLQEDKRFFVHRGVNPVSLIRAGWETYVKRSRRIGASTITMQTAKLKYKLYTKNIGGKLKQIYLALRLEFLFSKQEILDAYVNLAPCGKNIEGFEAASRYFFALPIEKTDFSQQLMLCVLPQDPVRRCPRADTVPQDLMNARQRLFETWLKSRPEYEEKRAFIQAVPRLHCSFPERALHFTRMIESNTSRPSRAAYAAHTDISGSGRFPKGIVHTSLDLKLQTITENALDLYVKQRHSIGINNAAALLIDWETMETLAAVGSAGFYNDRILGQIDANISKRSPGSVLKPFIYALALDQGLIHYGTMLKDTPSAFSEYTPDNYGNTFKGPIKAWQALTQSRNVPAVELARNIHNPDLYDFLSYAGISGLKHKDSYGLSIVLGSADLSPFELVNLYAALKNGGVQYHVKTRAQTPYRQNGEKTKPTAGGSDGTGKRLFSKEAAFIVCKMLEQNPPPENVRSSDSVHISAGYKTGTSIGFRDCWTIGFFGQYILCVWIGNFDGTGNNSFLGRTAAAPLFFNIADRISAAGLCRNISDIPPEGVKKIKVCSVSGGIPNGDCEETEEAWFIPGVSPITKCRIHRKITIDTRTGFRTDERDKSYCKTVVREFWPSDLMKLFAQAGLPRLVPPDYPNEDKKINGAGAGFPPKIVSPLKNTLYVFRTSTPEKNKIILSAVTDADTSEIFWFAGSSFITRCAPSETYEWQPFSGTYELTVTDNKGRSDSRTVKIEITE